jgi:hypothetical protein
MPEQKINGLDLDALEKEGPLKEPFTFTVGGKEWSALDPEDVDWQVAFDLDTDDLRAVLRTYLGDEKFAEFAKVSIPSWKMAKLADALNQHYSGNADGSPSS